MKLYSFLLHKSFSIYMLIIFVQLPLNLYVWATNLHQFVCIRIWGGKRYIQQELQSFSAWVWIQRFLTADLLQKPQFENRILSSMFLKAILYKLVSQVDY